jgi:hypothetical protein
MMTALVSETGQHGRVEPVIFARRGALLLVLALALGTGALLLRILISPGVALDDEITHALISLNAWTYPEALLHAWGRVGNTLAYMLPALLDGFEGRRVGAVIMTVVSMLIAAAIARRLGVRPLWLTVMAGLFQPWMLQFGYQGLTQMPFMLALIAGVWFALTERRTAAAFCFGLLAVIRHEGVALTGVAALFIIAEGAQRRRWRDLIVGLALLALPLSAYNLAYRAIIGVWPSGNLFNLIPTTEYGSGGWLHFVPHLAAGVGLPVGALALLGLIPAARLPRRAVLIGFLPFVFYFVLHTIIYRFGLYASGGYGVFLLPLAPAIAVLAGLGADWAARRLPPLILPPAGILIAGTIIGFGLVTAPLYPVEPLHDALRAAAQWVHEHHPDVPHAAIAAAHIAFWRFYDPHFESPWGDWHYDYAALPERAVLVWDPRYSAGRGADWSLVTDPASGWRRAAAFNADPGALSPPDDGVIIFERGGE